MICPTKRKFSPNLHNGSIFIPQVTSPTSMACKVSQPLRSVKLLLPFIKNYFIFHYLNNILLLRFLTTPQFHLFLAFLGFAPNILLLLSLLLPGSQYGFLLIEQLHEILPIVCFGQPAFQLCPSILKHSLLNLFQYLCCGRSYP